MSITIKSKLGQMPAHIASNQRRLHTNAAAHANLSAGFAVLSCRGKAWRYKFRGDEQILRASQGTGHDGRPLPEQPVPDINVIIVKMSSYMSKNWYASGYVEGANAAPDCFSVNGERPDPTSPDPQHDVCATCEWNQFGSRRDGSKGKACSDSRRIAIVSADDPTSEPMLFRVPATSLRNLDRYSTELERFNADATEVITKMSFNPELAYPEVMFEEVAWVDNPDAYTAIAEHHDSDLVKRMLEEPADEVRSSTRAMAPPATSPLATQPRPTHLQGNTQAPPRNSAVQQPEATAAPVVVPPVSPFAAAQARLQTGLANPPATQAAAQAQPQAQPRAPQKRAASPPVQAAQAAQPPAQTPAELSPVKSSANGEAHEQGDDPSITVRPAPDDIQAVVDDLLN